MLGNTPEFRMPNDFKAILEVDKLFPTASDARLCEAFQQGETWELHSEQSPLPNYQHPGVALIQGASMNTQHHTGTEDWKFLGSFSLS
jgi:hypothetical protein